MAFWNWITLNHVVIATVLTLILKWVYNAWTPGVTFPQFLRIFIGEMIQEAPPPPLTPAQQKLLAEAGVPAAHV